MVTLSYNLSDKIIASLKNILSERRKIILTPLSPTTELRMKWETQIEKIYWSLNLSDIDVSKEKIAKLLSSQTINKPSQIDKEVIAYKKALNYIKHNWSVTPKQVTAKDVHKLYEIAVKPIKGTSLTSFKEKKSSINHFLGYMSAGSDHPIIQAGMAYVSILNIAPFKDANDKVARLLTYLYLHKNGYDTREMIVFEESMRKDLIAYRHALASVSESNNLTYFLEYFAGCIEESLSKTYETISNERFRTSLPVSYFRLNDRQKEIVDLLENPAEKITNKQVQDKFGVSQITASRDLSKLASLGILFVHGKGRSVYYTRV